LVAILALVLEAGTAHGKCTLIAGHKKFSLFGDAYTFPANLTDAPCRVEHRLRLQKQRREI
jgi:hypothetical protein